MAHYKTIQRRLIIINSMILLIIFLLFVFTKEPTDLPPEEAALKNIVYHHLSSVPRNIERGEIEIKSVDVVSSPLTIEVIHIGSVYTEMTKRHLLDHSALMAMTVFNGMHTSQWEEIKITVYSKDHSLLLNIVYSEDITKADNAEDVIWDLNKYTVKYWIDEGYFNDI